ncbi:4976_t:CDS:2 [Funneliformis caledonium]|uniref:4976_t:CDS:1 n=1 Tax=Funneliformis caledonium TaxID=1117310 RepID=A0A9N9HDH7_9GLOM|nr:4976_t:CDS:2 [Funneliformis caledonium]
MSKNYRKTKKSFIKDSNEPSVTSDRIRKVQCYCVTFKSRIIEDIPTVESSRKLSQDISIDLLEADISSDNDLEIESIYQEETIKRQFRRQKKGQCSNNENQDNSDFDFVKKELFSGFAALEYAYSDDDLKVPIIDFNESFH